jgi:release factor glutamine methyltransferase
MKLLGEVLNLSTTYLKEKKIPSPRLVAETLLSGILGIKRMDLYLRFECPLQEEELLVFRGAIKKASLGEPVEYIVSNLEFYGLKLFVTPSVLIPRQETEILVDLVSNSFKQQDLKGKNLLDLCSGSGCIGLSLKKKFPELSVSLSDVSLEALTLSKKSADAEGLNVEFIQGDLLSSFQGRKADFVICNPPYISELEYEGLSVSVKGYEPKLALVGGVTGLEFYERLARDLPGCLKRGGKVFFEIGYQQGEGVSKIFSDSCWVKKEIKVDWSGKDRFFFLEIE